MKIPPDCRTSEERSQWIIDNADYFTVVRRSHLKYVREEFTTLAEATWFATEAVRARNNLRLLIYAVAGRYETYVTTINRETPGVTRNTPPDAA